MRIHPTAGVAGKEGFALRRTGRFDGKRNILPGAADEQLHGMSVFTGLRSAEVRAGQCRFDNAIWQQTLGMAIGQLRGARFARLSYWRREITLLCPPRKDAQKHRACLPRIE